MKIKKVKKDVLITTQEKKVLLGLDNIASLEEYSAVIGFSNTESLSSNKLITTPGEYEISDVLISVYNDDTDLDKPGVVVIDTDENIKVVYVSKSVEKINKNILEIMSNTDVLIMQLNKENASLQIDKLNQIEPSIFIPLVDTEDEEFVTKQIGMGEIERVKSLNISQKDFTEESSDTKLYILDN